MKKVNETTQRVLMAISGAMLLLICSACGPGFVDDACGSGDNSQCSIDTQSRAESIDQVNDPRHLGLPALNTNALLLSLFYASGRAENPPWPETYWPTKSDSVNVRWQGQDKLSPLEKYDLAFNNWQPQEGFMDLKPFQGCGSPYDKEYYESLGPAAKFWTDYNGNGKTRKAWRDPQEIESTCANESSLCNSTYCSICENKRNHCLYVDYFEKTKDDCEEEYQGCYSIQDQDILSYSCRNLAYESCDDTIDGWWGMCHAWTPAAILEKEPKGPVTYNGVTFEVSDLKGLMILMYDTTYAATIGSLCVDASGQIPRDENGRITNPKCRDVNPASMHLALTNMIGILRRALAEDRTMDYQIWNQPILGYQILSQQELNQQDAARMLDPDAKNYDQWNSAAERFLLVEMEVQWVVESAPSTLPITQDMDYYNKTFVQKSTYRYLLECNWLYNIIGGEWVGDSIDRHPDFIWMPTGHGKPTNPYVSYENVRELFDLSLE